MTVPEFSSFWQWLAWLILVLALRGGAIFTFRTRKE